MPVKKSVTPSRKSLDIEFVNWELTKEQKSDAKRYEISPVELFGALERLIDDGFRISFKFDDYNKCFNCSFTEPTRDGAKSCRCIVSRGPSIMDAARIACYKHFVILEGDWGNLSATTIERDDWG